MAEPDGQPRAPRVVDRFLRALGAGPEGKRLAGGSAGSFALKLTSIGAAFLTTYVLTNTIGAAGYGAYAYAIGWVYLLMIPALIGLDRLLLREIPVLVKRADWPRLRGLLRRSHQVVIALSLLIGAVVAAAALAAGPVLDTVTPEMLRTLAVAMIALPLYAVLRLRQTILLARDRVIASQLGELLILPGLGLVIVAALALAAPDSLTPVAAVLAMAVSALAGIVVLVMLARGTSPPELRARRPAFMHREWLTAAVPMLLVAGMQVLNQRVDILIVGTMLGAEKAGIYAVANRGALLLMLAFFAVNQPLAPVVSSLYEERNHARLQNLITRATRVMLLLAAPAAVVLIAFATPFLSLFGPEFVAGREPLIIIAAAEVIVIGFGSVSTLLLMTGHERAAAFGAGFSALLNIALNLLLIPRFGMVGAAWALAVGQTVAVATMSAIVRRRLGINSTPFGRTL
ncbi:MAG: hypothetical protein MAG453_01637 [Calditrichaeota bacterium]|nr:hypothetical protein [Calditrichota bacterium]